jgi:hypothetical protein
MTMQYNCSERGVILHGDTCQQWMGGEYDGYDILDCICNHIGKPQMKAQDFLNQAVSEMQDRAATYDKPEGERSMGATVAAFKAVTGIAMSEQQGWQFMELLKMVRSNQGAYRADSFVDGAAYAGLAGEAAARENGK